MRALRVVGISEDGGEVSVVLEDPVRHERFAVPADERLRAAARGDLTRLGQIAIELESQLRPREIQARIRAGASVEQVASTAGVPVQKIERFAYPVLLERSRTAEVAQRAHPVRADGPDARTLGDVVAHTFGLRGQEYSDADWDSWKNEDGRWVVGLSWRAGRSDNQAHWTYQPGAHGGTVTAVDEYAHDLVEGLPARPLRPVGPVIDMTRPDEPAPHPAEPLRAAASGTGRAGPVERPARPDSPEPRRSTPPLQRTDARPAEAPRSDHPRSDHPRSDHPSNDHPRGSYSGDEAPHAAGHDALPSTDPEPRNDVAPPAAAAPQTADREPADEVENPQTPAEDASADRPAKRTRKGKPVMPSWDEVLLGVRGQR